MTIKLTLNEQGVKTLEYIFVTSRDALVYQMEMVKEGIKQSKDVMTPEEFKHMSKFSDDCMEQFNLLTTLLESIESQKKAQESRIITPPGIII